MTPRDTAWLRGFLHLDAESTRENIPRAEIERQENTVLRAMAILDSEPGVLLADEVGMGKTFEALGLMAAFSEANPKATMLVLTPGPDLNEQWLSNIRRFRENGFYAFGENDFGEARSLHQLAPALRDHRIVFAPLNAFMGGRSGDEEKFILGAWMRWASLREESRKQIASAVYGSRREVPDVHDYRFMGEYSYDDLRGRGDDVFERAFRGSDDEQDRDDLPQSAPGLHNLYAIGPDAFSNSRAFNRAIARARFHLLNSVLPVFDLLIVDEAHKLKNPWSLRSQAVANILHRRYRKTAFLTATPFQLSVAEMEQVFNTFSFAEGAPASLRDDVARLFSDIQQYQERYRQFEEDWCALDGATAERFNALYAQGGEAVVEVEDALLRRLGTTVRELVSLKRDRIEPSFRRWMIRSVKAEKHEYRQAFRVPVVPEGPARLPFLVYERLLTELFRVGDRTYKAAVELNVSSSFEAALAGSLLSDGREVADSVDEYRVLLREMLGADPRLAEHHPKLSEAADRAYTSAIRGEKTLIFSERVESIRALRKAIEARWLGDLTSLWRQAEPELAPDDIWSDAEGRGRHATMQARFQRGIDALYLALRENYVFTLGDVADRVAVPEVVELANELLVHARTNETSATRVDYRLAKRCVEQAVFKLVPDAAQTDCVRNVLSPEYVNAGLDLIIDDEEGDSHGEHAPTWRISEATVRLILSHRGIWWPLRESLSGLSPDRRVRLAEAVTAFFVKKEVSFLPELLIEARRAGKGSSSEELRDVLESWWTAPRNAWREKLVEFVDSFVHLNPSRQDIVLEEALKTGQFVRDTLDQEAREKLREAFNTPFYPMVLIGNQVMQEGLDLHRNCRKLVHYDLAWNPAQLEQRVGRINRMGSLTHRRREQDGVTQLEMHFPLMERTIDEHQFEVVSEREKWLNLLLGSPPEFDVHDPSVPRPPPLSPVLVKDLTIELRPGLASPADASRASGPLPDMARSAR